MNVLAALLAIPLVACAPRVSLTGDWDLVELGLTVCESSVDYSLKAFSLSIDEAPLLNQVQTTSDGQSTVDLSRADVSGPFHLDIALASGGGYTFDGMLLGALIRVAGADALQLQARVLSRAEFEKIKAGGATDLMHAWYPEVRLWLTGNALSGQRLGGAVRRDGGACPSPPGAAWTPSGDGPGEGRGLDGIEALWRTKDGPRDQGGSLIHLARVRPPSLEALVVTLRVSQR